LTKCATNWILSLSENVNGTSAQLGYTVSFTLIVYYPMTTFTMNYQRHQKLEELSVDTDAYLAISWKGHMMQPLDVTFFGPFKHFTAKHVTAGCEQDLPV